MELERRTYTKSVKSVDLCGSQSFPCVAYKSAIIRFDSTVSLTARLWQEGWGWVTVEMWRKAKGSKQHCSIIPLMCKTIGDKQILKGHENKVEFSEFPVGKFSQNPPWSQILYLERWDNLTNHDSKSKMAALRIYSSTSDRNVMFIRIPVLFFPHYFSPTRSNAQLLSKQMLLQHFYMQNTTYYYYT